VAAAEEEEVTLGLFYSKQMERRWQLVTDEANLVQMKSSDTKHLPTFP